MNKTLCSIIIPYYNVPTDYVNRCLQSILDQNWDGNNYEVIFVNDGSQLPIHDSTKTLFKRFPDFTLIEQENQGPGVARNTGMAAAKGEYLFFIDADDYWFPNRVHFLFDHIKQGIFDVIKFSISNFDPLKSRGTFECETGCIYMATNNIIKGCFTYCYKVPFLITHNIIFPNLQYSEDEVFLNYAFFHAGKCLFTDVELYYYDRGRENSLSKQNDATKWNKQLQHYLHGITELTAFNKQQRQRTLLPIEEQALNRAFYNIILDYIYTLMNSSLNSNEKKQILRQLNAITPISPLPKIQHSLKYDLLQLCSYHYHSLQWYSKTLKFLYLLQGKRY